MNTYLRMTFVGLAMMLLSGLAFAAHHKGGARQTAGIEPTPAINYKVVKNYQDFELRHYPDLVVAETKVHGTFGWASYQAFNRLFNFISGKNSSQEKIPMTAPVTQRAADIKVSTTEKISQMSPPTGDFILGFVMPRNYTLEKTPRPVDGNVTIREIPSHYMAAVTYTGNWTYLNYKLHEASLLKALEKEGLKPVGQPVFARYDDPLTLSWNRRNEVMVEVIPPTMCGAPMFERPWS